MSKQVRVNNLPELDNEISPFVEMTKAEFFSKPPQKSPPSKEGQGGCFTRVSTHQLRKVELEPETEPETEPEPELELEPDVIEVPSFERGLGRMFHPSKHATIKKS